jgi:PAS domain S-box-containing protein
MKRYLKYLTRSRSLNGVIVVIVMLLAGAVFLSVLSSRNMKRITSQAFNEQQLELAKHAAGMLGEHFKVLKRELTTLSLSPSIQYMEAVSWANRMQISFSTVSEYGVCRILFIDAEGAGAYMINDSNAVYMETGDYARQELFQWCIQKENKGKVYVSDVRQGTVANSEPGYLSLMATPVYQVSTDEAHPRATQAFAGALVFELDAGLFARKIVGPIKSGRTGNAWVIDEKGNFLYHQKGDFVGQNAFEIRQFKDPHISFTKINSIQKELMLQGKEGTSWYVSGWHAEQIGKVEKLIAYAPVYIGAANSKKIWSVAVVAPIGEVEESVHGFYLRQNLLQGAIVAVVIIVLAFYIAGERIWLRRLEQMVEEKTRHLEKYAERLERSEERYRSLIESADDLIYTLDQDCNILSVNRYYSRLAGESAGDVTGKNVTDVIRFKDPEIIPRIVRDVRKKAVALGHEGSAEIEGREYWFDSKYMPILDRGGKTSTILVISRDITEHKAMEAQLFHAEKLASMGTLSAGVAHEINNPIAVILGFTEILLERFPEGSKEHEILKTIMRQGTNCQRIVENLLAFSRIPEKSDTETDVAGDLQKVLNVVQNTLLTKKVDLKTDIDGAMPRVRGNGREMEQVFLNIINNAVAAMPGGGILGIAAARDDGYVRIAFSDTGHGIPSKYMGRIFEPFFTTKKVGEGTGLGLSVSYGIVKKFGGDIRVKSQTAEKGKEPGTTFTVLLPLAETRQSKSVAV